MTPAVLFCIFKLEKAKMINQAAASENKNLHIIILVICNNISPKYITEVSLTQKQKKVCVVLLLKISKYTE